jgi:hypothetical protein
MLFETQRELFYKGRGQQTKASRELISQDVEMKVVEHKFRSQCIIRLYRLSLRFMGRKLGFGKIVDAPDLVRWHYDHRASVGGGNYERYAEFGVLVHYKNEANLDKKL